MMNRFRTFRPKWLICNKDHFMSVLIMYLR